MVQVNADSEDYLKLARQVAQIKKDTERFRVELACKSRSLQLNDRVAKQLQDSLLSTVSALSSKIHELDMIERQVRAKAAALENYLR